MEISLDKAEDQQQIGDRTTRLTKGELFYIFLKAGLAFGGGLGILAVLEEELVDKRRAVTKEEFLTIYGMGRIVPSGTMTALAVAYGFKFGGLPGSPNVLTRSSGGAIHPKSRTRVEPGEVVHMATPGGGGFGLPTERDRELIKRDLEYGYVTAEASQRLYDDA